MRLLQEVFFEIEGFWALLMRVDVRPVPQRAESTYGFIDAFLGQL